MKKTLIALMSFFLMFQSLPANAATVTATGSNPSICNQTVGSATNVDAYRLSGGDCVVEFKKVGTTTWEVPANIINVRYLIVGGGASGDRGKCSYYWGHGGGGGGVLEDTLFVTPNTDYTVTIGDGGGATANCTYVPTGNPGGNSTFGTITALGGQPADPNSQTGGTSGSGKLGGTSTGGSYGCTPGGCGAGSGGGAKNPGVGVNGGAGIESSITDSPIEYGGGGAGRIDAIFGTASGGGAAGSTPTANLGGGGSDASGVSTSGGSGIVILRYTPITDQTITLSSLETSSKTYPYSQALTMSTSGSSGSGAITYAVRNDSASGCTLTGSSSNETLTASTSGTCLVSATIAADDYYNSATSSELTFTFSKANQASLSIPPSSGSYGTPIILTTTGGNGAGSVTYSAAVGTPICTISGETLTADAAGTCLVTATKASDTNYNSVVSSAASITFAATSTTASISLASGALTYRQAKLITAFTSVAGKVTFRVNNKILPRCKKKSTTGSTPNIIATCSYRPSNKGSVTISATLNPTNSSYIGTVSTSDTYFVYKRTGARGG